MALNSGRSALSATPAIMFDVLGQVDRRHAALAEFPLDPVAVGEGGGEAVEGTSGHGTSG